MGGASDVARLKADQAKYPKIFIHCDGKTSKKEKKEKKEEKGEKGECCPCCYCFPLDPVRPWTGAGTNAYKMANRYIPYCPPCCPYEQCPCEPCCEPSDSKEFK